MRINYNLPGFDYPYQQDNKEEEKKLSFLLANNKGDFLNLGIFKNDCKYQGLNICNTKTLEIFKFLDELTLEGIEPAEIIYNGYSVTRKFKSKVALIEEENKTEEIITTTDKFYLGPTGGVVYEINNYEGNLKIDLDMRKQNDFDEWGREYNVFEENGILFAEYTKKNGNSEEYKLYFGVKATNFLYDLVKDYIKKDYEYSKQRGSLSERYVYRLASAEITGSKRIIFGAGFTKDEVKEQIFLLEMHQSELEKFDENIISELAGEITFSKPITQDVLAAYKLSNSALYKFLNKDLNSKSVKIGSYAGYPWFANIWARDELVGLRALINNDEEEIVKDVLYKYLNMIDDDTGLIPRIQQEGALPSADGVFWLTKRYEDFIYRAEDKKRLHRVVTDGELEAIYKKMHGAFAKIVEQHWDKQQELLKVKYGDSWMDTIEVNYPLDIQVQFLEMVSFLVVISQLLKKTKDHEHLKEFEKLLVAKIRNAYFRSGCLFNEPFEDRVSSNIFLVYYFYPGLFTNTEWEQIFDKALLHLKTHWGGIASLSQRDSRFKEEYTGENNLSYHNGDVWFWINNYAAIAMNHLNEKKYRKEIAKILSSSTQDILKMGTIGFASEISSAKEQRAQGAQAQLWSTSTYLELIDQLFDRE